MCHEKEKKNISALYGFILTSEKFAKISNTKIFLLIIVIISLSRVCKTGCINFGGDPAMMHVVHEPSVSPSARKLETRVN